MSTTAQAQNPYLEQIKNIVLSRVGSYDIKVYFFGSRAKNTAHRTSDVDVALLPKGTMPPFLVQTIIDALEESNIPYQVDVVDLSQSDPLFRNKVIAEGILWHD